MSDSSSGTSASARSGFQSEYGGSASARHFRAHGRRPVRLSVVLRRERSAWERPATVIDIHLAGAGVETDEPLAPGERLSIAFAAPNLWDPLVLPAVVAWAHPVQPRGEVDAYGRLRSSARAGLSFQYTNAETSLAMFEMLSALVAFE